MFIKKMEKVFASMLAAFTVFGSIWTAPISAMETSKDTTQINVVYDDSGSMSNSRMDSWSQAKYAMEVFSAFMGEEDTLNVFPMSKAEDNDSKNDFFTLKGTEDPADRVKRINDMKDTSGTPIQAVDAAGENLKQSTAQQKWLVILTDGAFFNDTTELSNEEIRSDFQKYAGVNGINMIYVGIGSYAEEISLSHDGYEAYYIDTSSILGALTEIAQKVFSLQKVTLQGDSSYSFQADVPISKFIVLAQGKQTEVTNAKINGEDVPAKPFSVEVSVNDKTPQPECNSGCAIAPNLNGKVVTYEAKDPKKPFSSGKYTFESTSDDVDVYVEPGIEFRTILRSGSEVTTDTEIQDGISIPGGESTVVIQIFDPLTGTPIDPSQSELLKGSEFALTVTDEDGNTVTYTNGEKLNLAPGKATLQSVARLPGNINMTGESAKLDVKDAPISVLFSQPAGYDINPGTLSGEQPVQASISAPDGTRINKDTFDSYSFEVTGTEGVNWEISMSDQDGVVNLTPSYATDQKGSGITSTTQNLVLKVTRDNGSYQQAGEGNVEIRYVAPEPLNLMITLQNPEETYKKGERTYMFDPNQRGSGSEAYILAKVQVEEEDGSLRDLNEDEWERGVSSFTFTASQHAPNFLDQLIRWVCFQSLEFDVVKDEQPSCYRFYLGGPAATSVLPNDLDLNVDLDITLASGQQEEGQTEDAISIMPLSLWAYLLKFILIVLASLLTLFLVYKFITKPRFKRGTYVSAKGHYLDRRGIRMGLEGRGRPRQDYELSFSDRINPFKPESATLNFELGNTNGIISELSLQFTAVKGGNIRWENPEALCNRCAFTFNHKNYSLGTNLEKVINLVFGYETPFVLKGLKVMTDPNVTVSFKFSNKKH